VKENSSFFRNGCEKQEKSENIHVGFGCESLMKVWWRRKTKFSHGKTFSSENSALCVCVLVEERNLGDSKK